ncbi:MAG: DUF2304 domain-containing protein [Actinomycetaceae bacterium]|nr:DUF2304 domain-containing protein [Actinomycetaceae bacterium]
MLFEMLGSQWFVKLLLIVLLLVVGYFILKPVKSAQHLAMRRLGMLTFIVFAAVTVLFPSLLTKLAFQLRIGRGTDLLLYGVVIFFFSSVVTAYRRDAATEKKLTNLARTIALNNVRVPQEEPAAAKGALDDKGSEVKPVPSHDTKSSDKQISEAAAPAGRCTEE